MVSKDLTIRMYHDWLNLRGESSTTKSTTPGYGDGPKEYLYSTEKPYLPKDIESRGLMAPDSGKLDV